MKRGRTMLESAGDTIGKPRVLADGGRVFSPAGRAGLCGAGILSLVLLAPAQASAELFTLRFTGTVTILPVNPVPGFETAVVGDPVTGSIEFDPHAGDSFAGPEAGIYDSAIRRIAMSVGEASLSLTGETSGLAVEDGVAFPPMDLISFGAADPSQTFQVLAQFLDVMDVIQGDRIPTDADVYMGFATRRFRILHVPDFDVSPRGLAGTIDSVTLEAEPVPEPGTLLLAATGAGLVARMRRRTRKRE